MKTIAHIAVQKWMEVTMHNDHLEESFQQQSLVPQKSRRTDLHLPENEYDALEGFGYTPDGDLPF